MITNIYYFQVKLKIIFKGILKILKTSKTSKGGEKKFFMLSEVFLTTLDSKFLHIFIKNF